RGRVARRRERGNTERLKERNRIRRHQRVFGDAEKVLERLGHRVRYRGARGGVRFGSRGRTATRRDTDRRLVRCLIAGGGLAKMSILRLPLAVHMNGGAPRWC